MAPKLLGAAEAILRHRPEFHSGSEIPYMKNRKQQSGRTGRPRSWRRLGLTVLAVAVAALGGQVWAQRADDRPSTENFDIRTLKSPSADEYLQRAGARTALGGDANRREALQAGVDELRATIPTLDVVESPELHVPEALGTKPGAGFLTGPGPDRVATLRAFLEASSGIHGLAADAVQQLEVVADYVNPAGNLAWVELEQRINGLPVFRGIVRGAFTAKGELARTTGVLASGFDAAALPTTPTVSAPNAVASAARSVGWTVAEAAVSQKSVDERGILTLNRASMKDDARAWLLYFPLAPGVVRLAWATEIFGDPDGFLTVVDAEDGTLLFRKNMTEYQSQAATYNVYLDDSPAPMSPSTVLPGSGGQAPFIGRTSVTLVGNEAPNTFNNLGWMTDGVNAGNGWTDGNNVEVGLDRDGIDGVDAPVAGTGRVFNFTYDPQTQEPLTPAFQAGEAADAFYWSNVFHDRTYQLGFTEAARNFQNDNFGRGGAGADRVRGELQDSSGTNNANFLTPADGSRGRMQMYLFTGPTPDRTSGLDHDVLLHELTHGLSNRLHSNAAGLSSNFARSMGEGWSDFYARALLATASEPVGGIYSTGGWVTNQLGGLTDNYYYGIRRFPYAVMTTTGGPSNRPHNPLTFADIDPAQINTTDGAYPNSPIIANTAFQVHNAGSIWAMALFEVRARFITRLGFAVGNQRILQFVTDGMKLDIANPTFLSGRDAILAAAAAGGGTAADIGDIWAGFAVRGMGYSATIVNETVGTVVEAFDLPGVTAGASTLVSESMPNGRIDPGEVVGMSICVANSSPTATATVVGTLLATGGVTAPSGAQSYGSIPGSGSVCRTFTFTVSAACATQLTLSLQAQESGGGTRTLTYAHIVGSPTNIAAEAFDGVTAPALPAGWTSAIVSGATANAFTTVAATPDTAPNRAFAADPAVVSDNALVSPVIAVPATGGVVQFRHWYATENGWDGGVLEIAIGAGAYQDIIAAGGTFLSGGYNGTLGTSTNPLTGRSAWTGNTGAYVTTAVRLPASAVGQNIRPRWRIGSDSSVSSVGWSIDTIVVYTYSCSGGGSLPGPLSKTTPANGATGVSVNTPLMWGASVGATSYQYCIDRTHNSACDTGWVTASGTAATLTGLTPGAVYSWQVRAVNGLGNTPADGGTWFTFTTAPVTNPYADLTIDFGAGVGLWTLFDAGSATPSWSRLHAQSPSLVTRANLNGNLTVDLVMVFPGYGVWALLDLTTWQNLHALDATIVKAGDLDGNGRDDLVIDFPGHGVWLRTDGGTWSRLHPLDAQAIAVGNVDGSAGGLADVVISFTGFGTYELLNSTTWVPLHALPAQAIEIGDLDGNGTGDIIMKFAGYGEYIFSNNATWVPLHGLAASRFITGNFDGDAAGKADILIAFPGAGTWLLLNGTTWQRVHSLTATAMAAGDVDANGADDITVALPGYGIWTLRNLTTWVNVHGLTPDEIVGARVNGN